MEHTEEYIGGVAGPYLFRRRPGAYGLYVTSRRIVLVNYWGKMVRSFVLVIAVTLASLTAVIAISWFFPQIAPLLPFLLPPSVLLVFYVTARKTRPAYAESLEELSKAEREIEIMAQDVFSIVLEKPHTLSGTGMVAITTASGGRITLRVAGVRAFAMLNMLIQKFRIQRHQSSPMNREF